MLTIDRFDVITVIRSTCDFCGDDLSAEGATPAEALADAKVQGWKEIDAKHLGLTGALWCGICNRRASRH